jgi:hypothetical protein
MTRAPFLGKCPLYLCAKWRQSAGRRFLSLRAVPKGILLNSVACGPKGPQRLALSERSLRWACPDTRFQTANEKNAHLDRFSPTNSAGGIWRLNLQMPLPSATFFLWEDALRWRNKMSCKCRRKAARPSFSPLLHMLL